MATTMIQTTEMTEATETTVTEEPAGDDIFLRAVREDSNLEMDWLWLATQVRSTAQRRYALERALRVNPRSARARRGLEQIRRRPDQPLDLS